MAPEHGQGAKPNGSTNLGDHLQVKGRLVDSVLVASEVSLSN